MESLLRLKFASSSEIPGDSRTNHTQDMCSFVVFNLYYVRLDSHYLLFRWPIKMWGRLIVFLVCLSTKRTCAQVQRCRSNFEKSPHKQVRLERREILVFRGSFVLVLVCHFLELWWRLFFKESVCQLSRCEHSIYSGGQERQYCIQKKHLHIRYSYTAETIRGCWLDR